MRPPLLAIGLCLALSTSSVVASADGAQDKATAEVLFREGRRLLEAGDVVTACARFTESQRLDPQVGTLINLALCHEKEGKLASAWAEFLEAAAKARAAGKNERADFAKRHAADLEPRLSRLSVRPPATTSATITVNGGAVSNTTTALPYDPGKIRIEASAPGKTAWSKEIDLAPGATAEVVVPELASATPAPAIAATPATPPDVPTVGAAPASGSTGRTLGFVALGVGAGGLALGAFAGLVALGKKGDLEEDPGCPSRCADADAVDGYNTMRLVSSVGFIAGFALAAAGAVLLFTSPTSRARAAVAPGGAVVRF